MGIRIQPLEVKVPPGDPFGNDLLAREEPAQVLTHLVESIEGPCVLAIDGHWGSGKTTFLTMWTQHLIDKEFPVVKFNAWETDYSAIPFISLATVLAAGPERSGTDAAPKIVEQFRRIAEQIAPWFMSVATTATLTAIEAVGGDPAATTPLMGALARFAGDRLSAFPGAQQSVDEFKATFQEMAAEISAAHGGRPLIVAIDELDRCRPTFAIELLETAKHLFSADHVVFVLTMNRQELAHSIKAVYGEHFDADGYLRRFVDVDFRLPLVDQQAFVNELVERTQIDDYFQRALDKTSANTYREILAGVVAMQNMSVRTIAQVIHRFALVLASLPDKQKVFVDLSLVALLLRATNMRLYEQFVSGQASDADCVDTIFGLFPFEKRFTPVVAWCEALIIATLLDLPEAPTDGLERVTSPLIVRYRELQTAHDRPDLVRDPKVRHAHRVLTQAESIVGDRWDPRSPRTELSWVVRRIELLSPEFLTERQETAQ